MCGIVGVVARRNVVPLLIDGLQRLEYRLYPGGRHEMFNEINRDEVVSDLLAWLENNL